MSPFSAKPPKKSQAASETERSKRQAPEKLRVESTPQAGWNDAYAARLQILSPLVIDRVESRIQGLLDAARSVPVGAEVVRRLPVQSRVGHGLTDSVEGRFWTGTCVESAGVSVSQVVC
jgi:hypothetical protein